MSNWFLNNCKNDKNDCKNLKSIFTTNEIEKYRSLKGKKNLCELYIWLGFNIYNL